jgi:hypothetical protein
MTSWHWCALVDEPPAGAAAAAAATTLDGDAAGHLAIWTRHAKPLREARRIDSRLLDPGGEAATVSLVRAPEGVRLPFDDVAVQQARRRVLSGQPVDAVTTLLSDASHFEGSLTVLRGGQVARLDDDPFARIFPAVALRVGPGLLGRVLAPAGPVIERYGSERPWPWDRFS